MARLMASLREVETNFVKQREQFETALETQADRLASEQVRNPRRRLNPKLLACKTRDFSPANTLCICAQEERLTKELEAHAETAKAEAQKALALQEVCDVARKKPGAAAAAVRPFRKLRNHCSRLSRCIPSDRVFSYSCNVCLQAEMDARTAADVSSLRAELAEHNLKVTQLEDLEVCGSGQPKCLCLSLCSKCLVFFLLKCFVLIGHRVWREKITMQSCE